MSVWCDNDIHDLNLQPPTLSHWTQKYHDIYHDLNLQPLTLNHWTQQYHDIYHDLNLQPLTLNHWTQSTTTYTMISIYNLSP